jgi:peptidoglycan hydrolase-like protein with peptidoglycan-binding domain
VFVRRLGNGLACLLVVVGLGLTSFAAADASTAGASKSAATSECATVSIGAHGPAVATLQRAVGATADGDFGPLTAKAVKAWQTTHKIQPTGAVDTATWRTLPVPVAAAACGQQTQGSGVAASCSTLRSGATGPAVLVLQQVVHVAADGAFGPKTLGAVQAAQKRLKLKVTGVVDAATWAALGRTGTPACVSAAVTPVKLADVTVPAPEPPADAAAQAKVRAEVLALAASLRGQPGTTTDQVALKALAFARAQIGKPYQWGGVGPASYDCSGLVMAAYRSAAITTPRVASDQYGVGVAVPLDQVRQGDLLFYAMDLTKPATIYHVVMYDGSGTILDAPYTGAYVGTRPLWTQNLLPVAWRPTAQLALPAKPGSTGWTVAQLQQALDRGGAKLVVDGGYGPATATAVTAWQRAHRLPATGVVDVSTWLTLD